MSVRVKRIYEAASPDDGYRLLIDRIWPRGVSRAGAALDRWLPDVAPSHGLRRWFGHEPSRWEEFVRRYHVELNEETELIVEIESLADAGEVTLLYSARDERHNQAIALEAYLKRRRE